MWLQLIVFSILVISSLIMIAWQIIEGETFFGSTESARRASAPARFWFIVGCQIMGLVGGLLAFLAHLLNQ